MRNKKSSSLVNLSTLNSTVVRSDFGPIDYIDDILIFLDCICFVFSTNFSPKNKV